MRPAQLHQRDFRRKLGYDRALHDPACACGAPEFCCGTPLGYGGYVGSQTQRAPAATPGCVVRPRWGRGPPVRYAHGVKQQSPGSPEAHPGDTRQRAIVPTPRALHSRTQGRRRRTLGILTQEGFPAMSIPEWRSIALTVLFLGAVATGAGASGSRPGEERRHQPQARARPDVRDRPRARPDGKPVPRATVAAYAQQPARRAFSLPGI